MVTAQLDQVIGLARAVLDRLESGDTLSAALAPARTVAELAGDRIHVCWLDFEIYGAGEVPGQKTPLQTSEERGGFAIFWQLHAVENVTELTVRVAEKRWENQTRQQPKKDFLLPNSIASIETMIETYRKPDDPTAAWDPDRALQFQVRHMEHLSIVQRVRDYLHRIVSGLWLAATDEKQNMELLGPDYKLVVQRLDALQTDVGRELESVLGLIRSDNPADWQAAALMCRNVILKLGRTLFPLDEETYHSELLGKSLDLKGEREKNRLTAFVDWHWRAAQGDAKVELERLLDLIERIYSKGSQGKRSVRCAEAQALVVDTFELVDSLDGLVGLDPVAPPT